MPVVDSITLEHFEGVYDAINSTRFYKEMAALGARMRLGIGNGGEGLTVVFLMSTVRCARR